MSAAFCFPRGALDIRNGDGTLMAFVCSSMPDHLCNNLLESFIACFEGQPILRHRALSEDDYEEESDDADTDSPSDLVERILQKPFHCVHFSQWNRYSMTVREVSLSHSFQADNLHRVMMPQNIFTLTTLFVLMSLAPTTPKHCHTHQPTC
jgi:hypothetical protein